MARNTVLMPEDVARELHAPVEWVEEGHWRLPHHVNVNTNEWFVVEGDLGEWRESWQRTFKRITDPHTVTVRERPGGPVLDSYRSSR